MKLIPLTQGQFAMVDDEDFERLNQFKWYAQWDPESQTFYAVRTRCENGKHRHTAMHREILKAPEGVKVDHRNHKGYDNQKKNLRLVSNSQNGANSRLRKDNSSGFKGVSWNKSKSLWEAWLRKNRRGIYLGQFLTREEAALAYDCAAKKHFGEFAHLNFP